MHLQGLDREKSRREQFAVPSSHGKGLGRHRGLPPLRGERSYRRSQRRGRLLPRDRPREYGPPESFVEGVERRARSRLGKIEVPRNSEPAGRLSPFDSGWCGPQWRVPILSKSSFLALAEIVYQHHERLDAAAPPRVKGRSPSEPGLLRGGIVRTCVPQAYRPASWRRPWGVGEMKGTALDEMAVGPAGLWRKRFSFPSRPLTFQYTLSVCLLNRIENTFSSWHFQPENRYSLITR